MANSDALCRLCSKEKKPLVPILEDNPLKVKEKMWNFLKIKVMVFFMDKFEFYMKLN